MNYLGINLINCVQDLYKKNYKTDKRNQRKYTQMERESVVMDQKTKYC